MKDILQNTTEIVVAFEKVMEGNAIGVFQLLDKIRKSVNCIRDAMFYEKISALMNELDSHQTDKRKIGELLAKSDYGKDYGFALLKYIDDFESIDKGRYLAHLLDSLSKDFITAQECFIYARLLKDVSLNGLLFVKNNVSSRRFDKNLILRELFRYNLMYEAIAMSKTPHIQYLCGFARHGNLFYHSQNLWFCIYSNNQLQMV